MADATLVEMNSLSRFLRAFGTSIVARSFFVISAVWAVVLVAGPVCLVVAGGAWRSGIVLGIYYAVVFNAGRRALPALLPRASPERPSVEILPADQEALWRVIDETAAALGAPQVGRVALTLEPVIEGDGSSVRLGLPLFAMLSVEELRALLAHRVAVSAVHSGSLPVAMAPVEVAIERLDERMVQHWRWVRVLLAPHAGAFLRLSRWATRRQQHAADERVAQAGATRALRDALRVAALAPIAWDAYWHGDVVSVLDAGYHPPMLDGFAAMLQAAAVRRELASAWRAILAERDDPHAAQPLPATRLDAARDRAQWPGPAEHPASELLHATDDLERRLLEASAGQTTAAALQPVQWQDVARIVHVDRWAQGAVAGLIGDLPALAIEPGADAAALGGAFAAALHRAGWDVVAMPGRAPAARRNGTMLEPWVIVEDLTHRGAASARWHQAFESEGIAGLPLAKPERAATTREVTASAHAAAPVSLRLPTGKRVRLTHLLGMVIIAALAVPIGAISVAAAFMPDLPIGGRAFMLAMGFATLACFGVVGWRRTRLVYGASDLTIDAETLTIRHPLMREPLVVPRANIRAVAVDAGDISTADPAMNRRFAIRSGSWAQNADPGATLDWLWRDGHSILPRLDVATQPPNLAIVIDPTVLAPALRHEYDHGPLRGEALPGLLVTVDDPAGARSLFAALGVLQPLDLHDVTYIETCVSGEQQPHRVALR